MHYRTYNRNLKKIKNQILHCMLYYLVYKLQRFLLIFKMNRSLQTIYRPFVRVLK